MAMGNDFIFTTPKYATHGCIVKIKKISNDIINQFYLLLVSCPQVHTCYGEQLGLTSDDEDYIDPSNYEEEELLRDTADSVSEEAKASSSSSNNKLTNNQAEEDLFAKKEFVKKFKTIKKSNSSFNQVAKELTDLSSIEAASTTTSKQAKSETFPTDMSDSSDSEAAGSKMDFVNDAECDSMHEGRQLVHTILPLNIETTFGLLFRKSKFFSEFHKMRKTTNLVQGDWEQQDDGTQKRTQTLTVAITQVVGPKQSHVTETQVMRSCSKPGHLYSIDASSENAGIPYADSFYVFVHYCMKRTVDDHTVMSVHAQVKYTKV
jgi:hypothetical protein